jgi:hypothetical protein
MLCPRTTFHGLASVVPRVQRANEVFRRPRLFWWCIHFSSATSFKCHIAYQGSLGYSSRVRRVSGVPDSRDREFISFTSPTNYLAKVLSRINVHYACLTPSSHTAPNASEAETLGIEMRITGCLAYCQDSQTWFVYRWNYNRIELHQALSYGRRSWCENGIVSLLRLKTDCAQFVHSECLRSSSR